MLALALLLSSASFAQDPLQMTLDEALRRLDERNTTIAESRAAITGAQGTVRMAAAAIQPIIGAQGSYVRNSHEAEMSVGAIFDGIESAVNDLVPTEVELDRSGIPDDIVIQPLEQWMGAASVQVPLIVASSWADLAAARKAVDAADATSQAVRLKVQSALVQACWMTNAAESYVEAGEHALQTATAHRDSAKRQMEAGIVTNLDVLRAETEVARRESDLAQARAELDKARLALGVLVGEDGPVRITVPDPTSRDEGDVRALVDQGLDARPEVEAREAARDAYRKQLQSARLRHLPTLGASFGYAMSDVAYPTGETWGWQIGVELTWALYDGGFRYGKARVAEGAVAGAQAALDGQKDMVALEIQEAVRDLEVARERVELAETRLGLAREAEASASRGYEAGLVDSMQVLDAQDALNLAEVAQVDAEARLGVAWTQLQAATGGGW